MTETLLATISSTIWGALNDRQKLVLTFDACGVAIDRSTRGSIYAAGRRFLFDNDNHVCRVLNYTTDGRLVRGSAVTE